MPFFRYNGWGLKDISGMLENAGTQNVSGGLADNYPQEGDPLFVQDNKAGEFQLSWLIEQFDTHAPEPFSRCYTNPKVLRVADCMVATVAQIARETTHKTVVVIFGRDMYPIQETLRVFQHKLRGTWIYVEGASRDTADARRFHKAFWRTFKDKLINADKILGVDTGYSGSVPRYFFDSPVYPKGLYENRFFTRLICCQNFREKRLFQYNECVQEYFFAPILRDIEHLEKPILRPSEHHIDVGTGMPKLYLANKNCILAAGLIMYKAREAAERWLPYLNTLIDSDVDLAQELLGVKTWIQNKLLTTIEQAPSDYKGWADKLEQYIV